jgi:hypothetical protein
VDISIPVVFADGVIIEVIADRDPPVNPDRDGKDPAPYGTVIVTVDPDTAEILKIPTNKPLARFDSPDVPAIMT